MKRIKISDLEEFLISLFQYCGMTGENSKTATEVFIRATYRGVQHHDINMIESRIEALLAGKNTVLNIISYILIRQWKHGMPVMD